MWAVEDLPGIGEMGFITNGMLASWASEWPSHPTTLTIPTDRVGKKDDDNSPGQSGRKKSKRREQREKSRIRYIAFRG